MNWSENSTLTANLRVDLMPRKGRAEPDRGGQTVAPNQKTVNIDFQKVNTALMNPATRAFTRPLKLS
jgi:hypothetical protein